MDFLDPKKKRANLIKLYVGYALMAVAIGIGTLIILYSSFGYTFDRNAGVVVQNGLVFVSSQPSGARIEITGDDKPKVPVENTNTRLTIREGRYHIKLTKEGYRDWQRDFELDGGSVEQLVYPMLFPKDLKTTDVQSYDKAPGLITSSPDRRWLLVQKPNGLVADFDVFEANEKEPVAEPVSIPLNILSASGTGTVKVVEWSTNNKQVLLKHTFGDKSEYILFNHEVPAESLNVNRHLGIDPTDVALFDKQADRLYVLRPSGQLELITLKDKNVQVVANSVVTFKPHGTDMVEYVSNETAATTNKVSVRIKDGDNTYTLRELPAGTTYLIDLARFNNHWYVVAGAASENKVYVYDNPLEVLKQKTPTASIPARTLRVNNPLKVAFSANARFISAQGDQKDFAVYDAETGRLYRYEVEADLDPALPAQWMDGHRLSAVVGKRVLVFDFDGSNVQWLNGALSATYPQFDREYTAIYTLASTTDNKFAVTRTSLRVEN